MRIHIGLVVLLGARLTQAEPFDPARALEQVTNEQLDAALVAIVRGACYRRDLGQSIEARLGWSPLPVRLGVALSFRWSEAIAADGRSILKTPAVPQAVTLSATDDTYDTRIELLERGAKDPAAARCDQGAPAAPPRADPVSLRSGGTDPQARPGAGPAHRVRR